MRFEAVVTIPGDIDLVSEGAEPKIGDGKLILKGECVAGAEVYADGHLIGTAMAIQRQDFTKVYADEAVAHGSLVEYTELAMKLEIPLPAVPTPG